jgi:hypothetical protein
MKIKLKHSVQAHNGKDWAAIAVLVPLVERKRQCWVRWETREAQLMV